MKTKAYKLAAELGVQEQSVLDWLRANGYPNARRADTIRADVAQAARQALGRGRAARRTSGRHPSPGPRGPTQPPPSRPAPRPTAEGGGGGFRVSFAELLEAHLPQSAEAGTSALPDAGPPAPRRPPPPRQEDGADEELRLRVARAEGERDAVRREADASRQRLEAVTREAEALRRELLAAKQNLIAFEALRGDLDRLQLERAQLRHALQVAQDERATLEGTCAELKRELDEVQTTLRAAEEEQDERDTLLEELESAMQREMAWRARALELERAANQDANLLGLLQALGIEDFGEQAEVLRALLASRDTALGFLRAIRQVESAPLERMVRHRIRRVCAHPVCNQVAEHDERVVLRVDDERICEVCGGDADRRWFARMVRECSRAGVRRLLVIGGEPVHDALRGLSQGQPVDLRLVGADDEVHPARVRGRVEGCDVLVLWSSRLVTEAVATPYADAARAEGRPVVSVLGDRCQVAALARAVCYRLARNHVLAAS